jgi:hypothetical protein
MAKQPRTERPVNAPEDLGRQIHSIKLRYVEGLIWTSDTPKGVKYRVTLHRTRGSDSQWDSFRIDDLPLVTEVSRLCYLWVCDRQGLYRHRRR